MRSLVVLLGLLVLARSQCTLYFDDCQGCLSDSQCGWCGDYCTSKDNAVCDTKMTMDASACPSVDFPVKQAQRQVTPSCSSKDCTDCIAAGSGCVWCQTTTDLGGILSQVCISNASAALCSNTYASPGTEEVIANSCPINPPATLFVLVFQGTGLDPTAVRQAIASSFDSFIAGKGRTVTLDYTDIIIALLEVISGTSAKNNEKTARQAQNTRVTFYGVSPDPSVYSQDQLNSDMQAWIDSLALNTNLGGNGPTVVGKGTTGSSKSGKDHLSGGDLAGIIVGVLVGAALITAIILFFLLLRRKKGYPAPFRSPAANFRP